MTLAFAVFLVLHGLIHLLGFAKAFRLADLSQLTQPVSAPAGALWLTAAVLFVSAAGCLFLWPRWWWLFGAAAVVVSMAATIPSWSDAKFGAIANAIAIVGVAFGFLTQGPFSLRAGYDRDVARGLARTEPADTISDADLAHLPEPVQRYLRTSGVVGQPRVRNFSAHMHGRFRNGPDARWMTFTAEQHNFLDQPSRLFYMTASMSAIPFHGYHRYADSAATMRIKAAGLVTVADVSGREMTRGETVTMFNDMCVMAPASLIDPAIVWEPVDGHTVRAIFTTAGHSIRADLTFNDAGELADFRTEDRYQTSPDGTRMKQVPWSTPLGPYRKFGSVRLSSGGAARWHEPDGDYAYIELELDDVKYNVER